MGKIATKSLAFFHSKTATGGEWYSLGWDPETGDVMVFHEVSSQNESGYTCSFESIELENFIAQKRPAQSALIALLGSLVGEFGL